MTTARDVRDAVSVGALRALGNDIVPELLRIVEQRALNAEETFSTSARALPSGWRHVVFAARMLDDIGDAGSLAGAFVEVRANRDLIELESFFAMLGAEALALALADARQKTARLCDGDVDPLDIESLREVSAESLGIARVRAQLTSRARTIATAFPAG